MLTRDIAKALAGRLDGDGAIDIERLVHPKQAERPCDLALAISAGALSALKTSKAHAAVVSTASAVPPGSIRAVIAIDDGRLALAKLTAMFDPGPAHQKGVHPSALIAPDAKLGAGVNVGAYTVIGARSRIGDGTTILSHVTIGADVAIGAQGMFHSGVRIEDRCALGERVIVHANVVIGSDGFSYAPDLNSPIGFSPDIVVTRVHSLGNVEIGAGTTIDRSTLETTRIGRGTKIDNLVHIGHNVVIGESCILAGMVGVSGSVTIGNRVRIAGRVGIADHVKVGDEAVIGPGSGVPTNVEAGAFVLGYPAIPHKRALEQFVLAGRQKRLHQQVNDIASRLDALEQTNKK